MEAARRGEATVVKNPENIHLVNAAPTPRILPLRQA